MVSHNPYAVADQSSSHGEPRLGLVEHGAHFGRTNQISVLGQLAQSRCSPADLVHMHHIDRALCHLTYMHKSMHISAEFQRCTER